MSCKKYILLIYIFVALTSCSPGFVLRSAYEESKILLKRKSIENLVNKAETPIELKKKLVVVLDAREFAIMMGLTLEGAFTKYSEVNKDVLLWVLAGSKPDSFNLYTWWYPIVGRVPYKGFFDREDAIEAGKRLKEKGYEYYIRGSEAFSTLGWFNDPVLSTTLKRQDHEIINTVIHESVHSTIWVPGHVPFNESLANFVGTEGAIQFYENLGSDITSLNSAKVAKVREYELATLIDGLYQELDALYKSAEPQAVKLEKRELIFQKFVAPFRAQYPTLKILKQLNNAEVMQLKFYLTGLSDFEKLFIKVGKDWNAFLNAISEIKSQLEQSPNSDPFELLKAAL